MNRETFSQMVRVLESGYGVKLKQDTKKVYWDFLKNYKDDDIKEATVTCVRESEFLPKISDIVKAIEDTSVDEVEFAWIALLNKMERIGHYQSVSFPDYPAIGAVVLALGGWISICETTFDEEKWVKKEFVKLYPIMKRRGEYPDKLIGQFELDNGNKYTEKFMLEEYGRKLDGTKIDRKLLNNTYPQPSVETVKKI